MTKGFFPGGEELFHCFKRPLIESFYCLNMGQPPEKSKLPLKELNRTRDDRNGAVAGPADELDPTPPSPDDARMSSSNTSPLPQNHRESSIAQYRNPINKISALTESLNSIATGNTLPFWTCQSIVASDVSNIPDIDDDLQRELAFYKQSLAAARAAGKVLGDEDVAVTRPTDFFAEMVKSDEHMQKVRSGLADKVFKRTLAAEMRRQRERKAFGKSVQTARLQERQRARKDVMSMVQLGKRSKS